MVARERIGRVRAGRIFVQHRENIFISTNCVVSRSSVGSGCNGNGKGKGALGRDAGHGGASWECQGSGSVYRPALVRAGDAVMSGHAFHEMNAGPCRTPGSTWPRMRFHGKGSRQHGRVTPFPGWLPTFPVRAAPPPSDSGGGQAGGIVAAPLGRHRPPWRHRRLLPRRAGTTPSERRHHRPPSVPRRLPARGSCFGTVCMGPGTERMRAHPATRWRQRWAADAGSVPAAAARPRSSPCRPASERAAVTPLRGP